MKVMNMEEWWSCDEQGELERDLRVPLALMPVDATTNPRTRSHDGSRLGNVYWVP